MRKLILLTVVAAAAAWAQTPTINAGGILNAASFATNQGIAPGSIVAIFGSDLAAGLAQADSVPLATQLANVSVSFNGQNAPLFFVSPGQINAQVPFEIAPGGNVNVTVTFNGATSNTALLPTVQLAPGVFQFNNHAIAVDVQDPNSARYATISAPSGSIAGLTTFPAQVGDNVFLYATGLGPVDPPATTGDGGGSVLHKTVNQPIVTIGGVQSQVVFSGLTSGFPGVYQVNFVIPAGVSGPALPLQIQMGGITSPASTTIAVQ
ncbi:MAG: IPT/TIG domain-containing protein [Acidobacteriota bacterium]|nr:IPT/TIG domain-containing protein [Acidobacteriota bacterium]